jgi:hypothetical protein
MAKRNTTERLIARGYLPRALFARDLRTLADHVERGDRNMMIRPPDKEPNLWVKMPITLYYERLDYDEEVQRVIETLRQPAAAEKE